MRGARPTHRMSDSPDPTGTDAARGTYGAVPHVNDLPGPAAVARAVAAANARRGELAWQERRPVRRYVNVVVLRDDKEAADTVKAWYSFREGRPVAHWELYNLLLAEALQNEKGRFYRMSARSWV